MCHMNHLTVKCGMPTILAIETSSELASVALLRGGQVLSRESPGVLTHSQTVLPMVQSLLQEAGIDLALCDAIAFGSGPGSFTGVRTACGVVQGLAFGADLPVIPVSTLEAMAQACYESSGITEVLAVMDARMGEVYWAQFRYESEWQTVVPPTLSVAKDVDPQSEVTACGNGLTVYSNDFATKKIKGDLLTGIMPHAAQIASLAAIAYKKGLVLNARDAQPFYLRNKVALTTSERAATRVTA
jgi:tRNA threonylcarbamoyladenosine biosynthesis protein TsaB